MPATRAIFLILTEILLIIVIYLHADVTRIAMATWLTHQMLGLSKFSIMAKFQESRTGGSQARFSTYHENNFCGKCRRGEFVYVLWNVPIQIFAIYIFFHKFRGLKWIALYKGMAPNFKTKTLTHSRLSLLLNNNNIAWRLLVNMRKVY